MKTITSLFRNRIDAENAVRELIELGASPEDVSIFVADLAQKTHFPPDLAGAYVRSLDVDETRREEVPYAPPDGPSHSILAAIAAGMAGGGILLSQGIGLLAAGPAVAAATVNRDPQIGTGPHANAVPYFMQFGMEKPDAEFFSEELKKGALMLLVRTNIEEKKVVDILHHKYGYVART